jgi:hypothetical protein
VVLVGNTVEVVLEHKTGTGQVKFLGKVGKELAGSSGPATQESFQRQGRKMSRSDLSALVVIQHIENCTSPALCVFFCRHWNWGVLTVSVWTHN